VFWGGYGGFVEFDAANLLTELSIPPDGV